jgi:hypothetical protein
MASLGPISFLGSAIDALKWAHCICCSSYRWLRMGLLLCWELLLMVLLGPITFLGGAADGFAWAHWFLGGAAGVLGWASSFFARRCRCLRMGPLNF